MRKSPDLRRDDTSQSAGGTHGLLPAETPHGPSFQPLELLTAAKGGKTSNHWKNLKRGGAPKLPTIGRIPALAFLSPRRGQRARAGSLREAWAKSREGGGCGGRRASTATDAPPALRRRAKLDAHPIERSWSRVEVSNGWKFWKDFQWLEAETGRMPWRDSATLTNLRCIKPVLSTEYSREAAGASERPKAARQNSVLCDAVRLRPQRVGTTRPVAAGFRKPAAKPRREETHLGRYLRGA